jgi:hypothetical protein
MKRPVSRVASAPLSASAHEFRFEAAETQVGDTQSMFDDLIWLTAALYGLCESRAVGETSEEDDHWHQRRPPARLDGRRERAAGATPCRDISELTDQGCRPVPSID